MVFFLGKTDFGKIIAKYESSVIGIEDCYILYYCPDDISIEREIICKCSTLDESRSEAIKYIHKDLPF